MAVVTKLFLEASKSGRDDRRSIGVGIPANSDVPPITCKAFVGSAHFSLRTFACNRQRRIAQTRWPRHPRSRREVHIPISATFQHATKIHIEVSIHSRAARRGASPPPKDLKTKSAPAEESEYKPWLHNAQNAGVSKKKKTKNLSHQQRLRQQRALDKADANVDKLEKKVADSKSRGKKVNARRMDWEELNEKLEGKRRAEEAKNAAEKEKKQNQAMPGQDEVLPDLEGPLPIRSTDEAPNAMEAPLVAAVPSEPLEGVAEPELVDEVL